MNQIWMMTNFWATVFWTIFWNFLSVFPFKLYHDKLSYIFSGTCITTYTNFTWILRLMTLRLDPATIRQSFASDQNWKRMCWLASFADFHQKPEPITMFTCPHVSKTFLLLFTFPVWENLENCTVQGFANCDLTSFGSLMIETWNGWAKYFL